MDRNEILKRVQTVTATILIVNEDDCTEDKSFTADFMANMPSVRILQCINFLDSGDH